MRKITRKKFFNQRSRQLLSVALYHPVRNHRVRIVAGGIMHQNTYGSMVSQILHAGYIIWLYFELCCYYGVTPASVHDIKMEQNFARDRAGLQLWFKQSLLNYKLSYFKCSIVAFSL